MKRKLTFEDYFFASAAIMGVGTISLFAVSTVLNLIVYLIK
jgi:hypothetical protein